MLTCRAAFFLGGHGEFCVGFEGEWGYLCAGLNRQEAENAKFLRERSNDPLGPESCADTARDSVKPRQGYKRGGRLSCENLQPGPRAPATRRPNRRWVPCPLPPS